MGFVYRVVGVLKALWIALSETINILRKLHETNISGCPRKFYHRVMYIAPSSGHTLLNLNLPFELIQRRFEVIFWCLERECCFKKKRLVEINANPLILAPWASNLMEFALNKYTLLYSTMAFHRQYTTFIPFSPELTKKRNQTMVNSMV